MAKRYSPFTNAETQSDFDKVVRSYMLNNLNIGKFNAGMPSPSPEWLQEQALLYQSAVAAWSRLRTWKKTRWSLCAYKKYGIQNALSSSKGYSGYTLYILCWLEQKPAPDKQPISPCSSRVTDPNASPWDYQP